jgi:hypothetical protein
VSNNGVHPVRTRIPSRTFEHFAKVARLIAGDQAPEWLPGLLHTWFFDLHRAHFVEHERPTRVEIRHRLDRVIASASFLIEELASPSVREFLEADPYAPFLDRDELVGALEHVAYRANQAGASSVLVTETGVTKAGSGRARLLDAVSPQTYCALIISDTWEFIHGTAPPPKSRRAAEAAEGYWRAAGGPAHTCGEAPLASWHYHFQLAREKKGTTLTAEYRRHLVEANRSWKSLHGVLEEAD